MNREIIETIQNRILRLLPVDQRNQPGVLLADSCSEVSRLIAGWIKSQDESIQIIILKGANVCDTKKSHDILAVITMDNKVYIIDPTIWQFFPQAESILVFVSENIDTALNKLKTIYGGGWAESEKFIQMSKDEEKKCLDIIVKNFHDN